MTKSKSGAYVRITSAYPTMHRSEKSIADYFLKNNLRIDKLSLAETATACDVSKAAVTRFCKRLGYNGLKDFKLSAVDDMDNHINLFEPITSQPLGSDLLNATQVCHANAKACTDTSQLMDDLQLKETAELFLTHKNIFLFGEGPVSCVVVDLYQKMLRLGIFPVYTGDRRMQNMQTQLVKEGDLVCVFDLSGSTRSAVEAAARSAQNGATVLAICNIIGSPLSKHGHINLFGSGHLGSHISGTLAPRIALLCIVDCLFNALIQVMGDDCKESIKKTSTVIREGWY